MMKKLLIATLFLTSFALGYGAVTHAWPFFGRNAYYGYFNNKFDSAGVEVLPRIYDGNVNAIPNSVDTAAELIALIEGDFYGGNNQQRAGASFIIDTMENGPHIWMPSYAEVKQWETDLYWYEANGWINWNLAFARSYNSFYQGSTTNDDAFYADSATSTSITFTGSGGWIHYGIRRQCANPVGTGGFSPLDRRVFNMSGHTTVSNANPNPGDTITFTHYVKDDGPNDTSPTHITATAEQTSPGATTTVGGPTDWSTFTNTQEKTVFTINVLIPVGAAAGTQYCQRVGWTPINSYGGVNGTGTPVCATVASASFGLTPSINITVNGVASPGGLAEVGDNVQFTYAVNNAGPGASSSVGCTIYGLARSGYYNPPTPADSVSDAGYTPPASGCPRIFNVGNTTLATETIAAIPIGNRNQTICRSLYVNPSTAGGSALGTESCVHIVIKPYARVYGGDIAAGGGVMTAPDVCAANNGAAIIGWNKRDATYSGAGVQFAAYALNTIADTASSSLGGGATSPTGLSFANTATDTPNGNFGGSFDSMPCIPNYWDTLPVSGTQAVPASIGAMTSGIYYRNNPNTYISSPGNVDPGERITVYIEGDLHLNLNVTYTSPWTTATAPYLRVIVHGNIFINRGVTQLDGLYVAQPLDDGTKGIIYDCADTVPSPYTPLVLDGTLASKCSLAKLTVNGAFVAKQVQLLRTVGTLHASPGGTEASSSANIGEVFNYTPALWMVQPPATSGSATYDAIATLPPIL